MCMAWMNFALETLGAILTRPSHVGVALQAQVMAVVIQHMGADVCAAANALATSALARMLDHAIRIGSHSPSSILDDHLDAILPILGALHASSHPIAAAYAAKAFGYILTSQFSHMVNRAIAFGADIMLVSNLTANSPPFPVQYATLKAVAQWLQFGNSLD
ncbi:hypothetical protein BC828DRAFT_391737 [Blastocladiella britannica]|nr:hypothetical protein BC828DRAFT_391737 [Blastocladiella britannica]